MYLFVLSLVSFQYFVFNTFCLFDRPCAVDITLNSLTYFLVYSFQCVCVCVCCCWWWCVVVQFKNFNHPTRGNFVVVFVGGGGDGGGGGVPVLLLLAWSFVNFSFR